MDQIAEQQRRKGKVERKARQTACSRSRNILNRASQRSRARSSRTTALPWPSTRSSSCSSPYRPSLESMTGDKNDQGGAAARLERAGLGRPVKRARSIVTGPGTMTDVFGRLKVTGTRRIAELLVEHLPQAPDTRIIDLGCGTGAAGAVLKSHGLTTIDGLDLSPEMLLIAADCGAYRLLIAADLLAPLPLRDHRYDAAISAGTLTTGHRRRRAARHPPAHPAGWPAGLRHRPVLSESGGFADAIQRLVSSALAHPPRYTRADPRWRPAGRPYAGV